MDRTKLFDILFDELFSNQESYLNIDIWGERNYQITDDTIYASISKEYLDKEWAESKKDDKLSLRLTFKGKEIYKKYGSYSSFSESEKATIIKANRFENIKIFAPMIITIISIVVAIIFGLLNYQKGNTIKNQKIEIENLNKEIDSIKNEFSNDTTKTIEIKHSDSTKLN